MPIFTIEIVGRGVMAFVAPNLFTAEAALEDEAAGILDGLLSVADADGTPLLNVEDAVTVREATEDEQATWHQGVTLAIQEGALRDPAEAISEGFVVYLVPVTAVNDDDFDLEREAT